MLYELMVGYIGRISMEPNKTNHNRCATKTIGNVQKQEGKWRFNDNCLEFIKDRNEL